MVQEPDTTTGRLEENPSNKNPQGRGCSRTFESWGLATGGRCGTNSARGKTVQFEHVKNFEHVKEHFEHVKDKNKTTEDTVDLLPFGGHFILNVPSQSLAQTSAASVRQ